MAAEVAAALSAALDVLIVRKIGAPRRPELAVGAIAAGGALVLNAELIEHLGVSHDDVDAVIRRERIELDRRNELYRGDRPLDVAHRHVIVVDDGAATGASMAVALDAVRTMDPASIVAALPVASRDAVERLRRSADDVVVVAVPEPFYAVGAWYDDFRQTSDAEVIEALSLA